MIKIETPYRQTTENIEVQAAPLYLSEESAPQKNQYFFMYGIKIINHREEEIQLISREWIINDGNNQTFSTEGEGVVGEMPIIQAKESFQYNSLCPLKTPTGNMRGSYMFKVLSSEERIKVKIPLFFLRTADTPSNTAQLYKSIKTYEH